MDMQSPRTSLKPVNVALRTIPVKPGEKVHGTDLEISGDGIETMRVNFGTFPNGGERYAMQTVSLGLERPAISIGKGHATAEDLENGKLRYEWWMPISTRTSRGDFLDDQGQRGGPGLELVWHIKGIFREPDGTRATNHSPIDQCESSVRWESERDWGMSSMPP